MFRYRGKDLAPKGGVIGILLFGPSLISVRVSPLRSPDGETGGKWIGPSGYCLGVVGERSSGNEAATRVEVERGEVRIPE